MLPLIAEQVGLFSKKKNNNDDDDQADRYIKLRRQTKEKEKESMKK